MIFYVRRETVHKTTAYPLRHLDGYLPVRVQQLPKMMTLTHTLVMAHLVLGVRHEADSHRDLLLQTLMAAFLYPRPDRVRQHPRSIARPLRPNRSRVIFDQDLDCVL